MSKKRAHKTLSLEEKLMILDELSSKTHRQLAEIRHLYIANTHYNDIHYYYNDIHYFNNPNISLIRPPSGPKLFGLVRVYCTSVSGDITSILMWSVFLTLYQFLRLLENVGLGWGLFDWVTNQTVSAISFSKAAAIYKA